MKTKDNNRKTMIPLLQWICTDSLAWIWGILGMYLVIILLLLPFHPPWDYDAYGRYRWQIELSAVIVGRILTLAAIIGGGIGGTIFGLFQRSFLRHPFGKLKGWLTTTSLGWALGCGFMAANSWRLSSTLVSYDMDYRPIPPSPIQDFSLSDWLGTMAVGAALGSIIAGLVQGFLLRKRGQSLNSPPRGISVSWPLTTILGMISGLVCTFCIESFVDLTVMGWDGGSREASMLRLISPLWSALLPGFALAFFTGIPILKTLQDHATEIGSPVRKLTRRFLGFTAIAFAVMVVLGFVQIGLRTGGWLDRAVGASGVERELKGDAQAESLSFTQDGQLMTSIPILDDDLKIWNVFTGKPAYRLQISDVAVLTLSPNGELLATGGYYSPIELWSLPDGRHVRTLFGPNRDPYGRVEHIVFSSDHQLMASSHLDKEGHIVQLWRLSDGALLGEINVILLESLVFLPDDQNLLIGTSNGKVLRWEPPDPQAVLLLDNLGLVKAMDFSADGNYVAIACTASPYDESPEFPVQVWRIADGTLFWSKEVGIQDCLDISVDGQLIATSSHNPVSRYEDPIYIWHLQDGALLKEYHGQCDLAFSPDSRLLAAQGADFDRVRLWSLDDIFSQLNAIPPGE